MLVFIAQLTQSITHSDAMKKNTFMAGDDEKPCTDLSEFRFSQLMRAQPPEGSVQLEQLQGVAVEPTTDQETREARRQEEQRADVSLISHRNT